MYELHHKASGSITRMEIALDQSNRPRPGRIKMIAGNVISLQGVRDALDTYEINENLPNDLA